jgi:hypothetical protein
MGILDELLTGGQRQNEYKEFVKRYVWRCPASGASVRVKSDHRHPEIPDGQGRACGHRGHGSQARHGSSVLNDVARERLNDPTKQLCLVSGGFHMP